MECSHANSRSGSVPRWDIVIKPLQSISNTSSAMKSQKEKINFIHEGLKREFLLFCVRVSSLGTSDDSQPGTALQFPPQWKKGKKSL